MLFTRQWLKEHYIDKRMSVRKIAEIVGCSVDGVYDYVRLLGLRKRDEKLRWGGKTDFIPANKGKPCQDHVKAKKRANMPHRKPVVMLPIRRWIYHIDTTMRNKLGIGKMQAKWRIMDEHRN